MVRLNPYSTTSMTWKPTEALHRTKPDSRHNDLLLSNTELLNVSTDECVERMVRLCNCMVHSGTKATLVITLICAVLLKSDPNKKPGHPQHQQQQNSSDQCTQVPTVIASIVTAMSFVGSRWRCLHTGRTFTQHTGQAVHVCQPQQQQQRTCHSPGAGWLQTHVPVVHATGENAQPPEGVEIPAKQHPEPQPGHHHHSHDETDQQSFQQTLTLVQQQSYGELQQLLEDQPQHKAFSASFLFWLSAQEKKATGQQKQVCMQGNWHVAGRLHT